MRDEATYRKKNLRNLNVDVPGTFYEGEGWDLNRPRVNSWINNKKPHPHWNFDPLMIMEWFNCDDNTHRLKKLPKQVDLTKVAKRNME